MSTFLKYINSFRTQKPWLVFCVVISFCLFISYVIYQYLITPVQVLESMNINSEILVQTDYQINSVLEQFGITKMVFSVNLSNVYVWTFFQTYLISVISGLWYDLHIKTYRIFRKILQLILSFGQPTFASTKNYMFGRIVKVLFNFYMRFLIKKKILAFWRCNAQVFKIKSSVMFQQMVKSNFGLFYPYKNRLLNYTPFLKVIFYTILCHNFNGLVFSQPVQKKP